MKRHPALIPLSRDHHNGLVQAVRLRRAAADGDAAARLAAATGFGEFFRNEEGRHGDVEFASEPFELHVLDACLAEESRLRRGVPEEKRGKLFFLIAKTRPAPFGARTSRASRSRVRRSSPQRSGGG